MLAPVNPTIPRPALLPSAGKCDVRVSTMFSVFQGWGFHIYSHWHLFNTFFLIQFSFVFFGLKEENLHISRWLHTKKTTLFPLQDLQTIKRWWILVKLVSTHSHYQRFRGALFSLNSSVRLIMQLPEGRALTHVYMNWLSISHNLWSNRILVSTPSM